MKSVKIEKHSMVFPYICRLKCLVTNFYRSVIMFHHINTSFRRGAVSISVGENFETKKNYNEHVNELNDINRTQNSHTM